PVEERFAQAGRTVEGGAVGQFSPRVHRTAAVFVAIFADEIEVLQREADGIHHRMTRGTGRAGAMLLEPLTDRCRRRAWWGGEVGFNAGWGLRHGCAEQVFENPLAALDRRGAIASRRHRQEAAMSQQSAPGTLVQCHATETAATNVGD